MPDRLREHRLFVRLVSAVLIAALATTLIGLLVGTLFVLLGLGLTAVFAIWWCVLAASSDYKREVRHRQRAEQQALSAFEEERRKWDRAAEEHLRRFDALKVALWSIRQRALQLRPEFQQELAEQRRQIEAHKYESQLEEFLETHFLRNYKIPMVGRGRLATLISYGIETAADIDEDHLDTLPGFGATIIGELTSWRDSIARQFRYDPDKPAPAAHRLQSTYLKYRQLQQTCEVGLTGGVQELQALSAVAQRDLQDTSERIERLFLEYRQAYANVRAT